jgi:hypothetical protein
MDYDIIYMIGEIISHHDMILPVIVMLMVCRIIVVSPKLIYNIIVHIKNMICSGKKVK